MAGVLSAHLDQVGRADRRADLGHDDPRRRQHRRRRRATETGPSGAGRSRSSASTWSRSAAGHRHALRPAPLYRSAATRTPTRGARGRRTAAGAHAVARAAPSSCSPSSPASGSPELAGAANLGVALGIGQLCFVVVLLWVLQGLSARPAAARRPRRSSGVVILMSRGGLGWIDTSPPAGSTSSASSVAAASRRGINGERRRSAPDRKTCGVCAAQSRERSAGARSWSMPFRWYADRSSFRRFRGLLDRVGDRRGRDRRRRRRVGGERRDHAVDQLRRQ